MEHYKYPQNKKKLENPSFVFARENFSCGDKIALQGLIIDGVLVDVGFEAQGCVISQATASLLTDRAKGKSIDELLDLSVDDVQALVGIELGPNRLKCALLSLDALKRGIALFLGNNQGDQDDGPKACSLFYNK